MKFKSQIELEALNNATSDTDKFLVSDGGVVKFKTGGQLLSDLGISNGYVPYVGAIANVNLGSYGLTSTTLTVNKNSGSGDAAVINKGGSGNALVVNKNSGSGHAALFNGGNVGIGITNPNYKLEIDGNIKLSETAATTDTDKFAVLDNGVIKYRTGVQVLSDIGGAQSSETYTINEADSIFTSKTLSKNISFGESYASNYRSRVLDNGGTFYPRPLGYEIGLMKEQDLFNKASLCLLPSGVRSGKVYNIKPENNAFDFTRNSEATYVDEDGLIAVADANIPRLDYSDGDCPSLLLEPSRTNLYSYSNQFDVYWSKNNISAIPNSIISPEGILNGYFLRENTSNASHDIRQNATIVSDLQYTYSVFVKKSDVGQDRNLSFYIGGTNGSISFNTTNGTFFNVGSVDSYSSEDYGNGWWRLQFTDTSVSTSFNVIAILNNGSTIYSGDGVSGVYIYGAQLEQGSYATSYIPTSGSAATRVGEETIQNLENQISKTDGVFFVDFININRDNNANIISVNSLSNSIFCLNIQYGPVRFGFRAGSQNVAIDSSTFYSVNQRIKAALVYKSGNTKLFINGQLEGTNTDTFTIGSGFGNGLRLLDSASAYYAFPQKSTLKEFKIYNQELTDQELINLTKI